MSVVRPFAGLRPTPDKVLKVACPPYDVVNTKEARAYAERNPFSYFHISRPEIDLPGVDPATIDIDVDDRTLTVRAERPAEVVDTSQEGNAWVSRERSHGTYARQIALGRGLDTSGIAATYTDGVLTLTIPVAEEAKPRKIAVTTAASNPVIEPAA